MQTITLQPGEELRVVCAGAGSNSGRSTTGMAWQETAQVQELTNGGKRGSRKNRTERKTRKAQAGGKRGPNPFMKFAAKERKNIMNQNPGMPVTEVGKELGKRWRALSDAEKKKY
jgi:hypothetical protein